MSFTSIIATVLDRSMLRWKHIARVVGRDSSTANSRGLRRAPEVERCAPFPKKGTWGEDGVILSLEPLFRFFPPPFRCHPFDSMIVTRALRPFLSPLSPKGELRSCYSAGSPIFVDRIISSVMNAGTIGGWCNCFD